MRLDSLNQRKEVKNMRKINKKGVSFQEMPNMILTLVIVGGLALGGFVTWQALADSTSNTDATAFLGNITLMFTNLGTQLPTIGTIIGVGLLIAVVVGAFVIGRNKGVF